MAQEPQAPAWVDLGSVEELRDRPLREIKAGSLRIALSYRDGQFGAISGICNHVGGPLGEGSLDGRIRRLSLAPLQVPPQQRRWRARLRRGPRPAICAENRERPPARQSQGGQGSKRTCRTRRIRWRASRSVSRAAFEWWGSRPRSWTTTTRAIRPPRRCSNVALAHAKVNASASTRLIRLNDLKFRTLRGLLLQERSRLHLAVLDHADGRVRPAGPGVRSGRALGGRRPARDADPLGRAPARSTTRWSSG